eukprot:TRINITY_DN2909_c0_g1_i6.p1 TRINITY_DN2909_c0_g1~~TRINITY_DN2909_c0_g1_i6.p1  ORF type:complete len:162 (+),score=28.34 TRINITY_DN2909_c0_g1_i6:161-646(+)
MGEGLFDEYVPQMYHFTAQNVINETEYSKATLSKNSNAKLLIGFAVDHSGDPIKKEELVQLLTYINKNEMDASVWYNRGIIETYPEQFKSFWAQTPKENQSFLVQDTSFHVKFVFESGQSYSCSLLRLSLDTLNASLNVPSRSSMKSQNKDTLPNLSLIHI